MPATQTTTKPAAQMHDAETMAALAHLVDLVEGWAYGPLFKNAGVEWPDGTCQAPALVKAKALIAKAGAA